MSLLKRKPKSKPPVEPDELVDRLERLADELTQAASDLRGVVSVTLQNAKSIQDEKKEENPRE